MGRDYKGSIWRPLGSRGAASSLGFAVVRASRLAALLAGRLGSGEEGHFDGPDEVAAGTGFLADSGTRNSVWQLWHLTSFPRTSSGTDRNFRHRRLGQIN